MYDVTNTATFESLEDWLEACRVCLAGAERRPSYALVANKIDQVIIITSIMIIIKLMMIRSISVSSSQTDITSSPRIMDCSHTLSPQGEKSRSEKKIF